MAIFYADEWQPDFGMPYPRWWADDVSKLPDDDLRTLAEFHQKTQAGLATKADLDQLPAHLTRFGSKLLTEYLQKQDPIQFGWIMESWKRCMDDWKSRYIHVICGGNRSSKSSFAASLVVHAAMSIPEAKIRVYHVNEEKSIIEQQAMVWAALPARYKNLGKKKGTNFSIQYSQKNGFTSSKLILPPLPGHTRGSEILFCNYQQYKNDAQTAEGWWAHLIWCDEEAPAKLFETLQYRLIDAHGRMILTFTTLNGWTPLVSDLMTNVKTVEKRYSPILKRDVHTVQDSRRHVGLRIYYWWTIDNPFVDGADFTAKLAGKTVEEVLARAHGIPTKSTNTPLPKFDETVHVIPHEKLPWLSDKKTKDGKVLPKVSVTRYHVADPSGSKPWAQLWAAVDGQGKIYIYHEFPDETYGSWGEPGNDAKGKRGPAQKPMGWGYSDYVDLARKVEGADEVYERFMDPRLGNAQSLGTDGATSIITEMDEAGLCFIAAPGLDIAHGLSLINDRLNYDEKQPISAFNTPRLFISDRCVNLIECMKNYTGEGGKDEVWKDFIDCLRYLLEAGADYVREPTAAENGRTFSY